LFVGRYTGLTQSASGGSRPTSDVREMPAELFERRPHIDSGQMRESVVGRPAILIVENAQQQAAMSVLMRLVCMASKYSAARPQVV
jgi:hypothetical protein